MLVSRNADAERQAITAIEGLPVRGDVTVKPLMSGDGMVMLEVHYAAGSASPVHVHQHESLCYVVSGRAEATVGDESFTLGPGDVCRHPDGVPHGLEAIEETTVIEVKSPAQPLEQFLGT
ncbi:MAG: cupin domain-containing protein [Chloroflexi bacterium]|nr:cupin domain-containing protein [Chloroflexota bacterium]